MTRGLGKAVRLAVAAGGLALVAACAATGTGGYGAGMPGLPRGSVLVLQQSLELPPSGYRVFVQNGRVLADDRFDRFAPHCSLGVRGDDGDRAIERIPAGRFRLGAPSRWIEAGARDPDRVRVAGIGWAGVTQVGPGGGVHGVEFWLRAELEADDGAPVRDLRCAFFGQPHAGPVTIDHVRTAFGGLAEIRPAGESG